MKNSILIDAKEAANQGLKSMREALGYHTDPDLLIYEQAQPEDFNVLSQEVGFDKVSDYIKTMEVKRLRGGK